MHIKTLIKTAFFLALAGCLQLFGQITIGTADMPLTTGIYHFHTSPTAGVDFTTTGPSTIWDYTSLANSGSAHDTFVDPATTPWVYQLVFNNFFNPLYDATHAQPGSNIVLPAQAPFQITEVFNFYKNSAVSFSMVGFGATINGLPTPIEYQGGDVLYAFPLGYGNVDTSTYSFNINVPSIGYWKQAGIRFNHVDGYGTLLLPNNVTYDVIRLRSELHVTDSVHIDQLGFTLPIPRIQTDYKFMAMGEGEPVLQITTQPLLLIAGPETVTAVKYKNEMNLGGIENTTDAAGFVVYPNPSATNFTVSNTQNKTWNKLSLINTSGQVVYTDQTGGSGHVSVNVSQLSRGLYYLLLEQNAQVIYRQKIQVQ